MHTERFREALLLAFHLHEGQTWPGSSIPYFSHVLEVACRAAAWGAREDTVIAGLLHDAARDRDAEATLKGIRDCFGERVASILRTCWVRHLLPHGNLKIWLEDESAPLDPELQLLVTCDALSFLRNGVMDWTVLAGSWALDPLSGQPARDPLGPDQTDAGVGIAAGRVPLEIDSVRNRAFLIAAYRSWAAKYIEGSDGNADLPTLQFPFLKGAWDRLITDEALATLMETWGLQTLAKEARTLCRDWEILLHRGEEGLLTSVFRDPEAYTPEFVAACLRQMTVQDLVCALGSLDAPAAERLRSQLPSHLSEVVAQWESDGRTSQKGLTDWFRRSMKNYGLELPVKRWSVPASEGPALTARYSAALSWTIDVYEGNFWPTTSIPLVSHALEVSSLVLSEGGDELSAIMALLNRLPRTETMLRGVEQRLGRDVSQALRSCWSFRGLSPQDSEVSGQIRGESHRLTVPNWITCLVVSGMTGWMWNHLNAEGRDYWDDVEIGHVEAIMEASLTRNLSSLHRSFAQVLRGEIVSVLRFLGADYGALANMWHGRVNPARDELIGIFRVFRGFLGDSTWAKTADAVILRERFGCDRDDLKAFLGEGAPSERVQHVPWSRECLDLFLCLTDRESASLLIPEAFPGLSALAIDEMLRRLPRPTLVAACSDSKWEPALKAFVSRLSWHASALLLEEIEHAHVPPAHSRKAHLEIAIIYQELCEEGVI